jgi:phage terminase Nu1 subunit (DNA packaging protein)
MSESPKGILSTAVGSGTLLSSANPNCSIEAGNTRLKMTNTITKKRLCELFDVSYNTLQQQFTNGLSNPPEPIGKVKNNLVYDMDLAVQWVNSWQARKEKNNRQPVIHKLMNLNVKWGKPREIVQRLDKLKKEYYSQDITE